MLLPSRRAENDILYLAYLKKNGGYSAEPFLLVIKAEITGKREPDKAQPTYNTET